MYSAISAASVVSVDQLTNHTAISYDKEKHQQSTKREFCSSLSRWWWWWWWWSGEDEDRGARLIWRTFAYAKRTNWTELVVLVTHALMPTGQLCLIDGSYALADTIDSLFYYYSIDQREWCCSLCLLTVLLHKHFGSWSPAYQVALILDVHYLCSWLNITHILRVRLLAVFVLCKKKKTTSDIWQPELLAANFYFLFYKKAFNPFASNEQTSNLGLSIWRRCCVHDSVQFMYSTSENSCAIWAVVVLKEIERIALAVDAKKSAATSKWRPKLESPIEE